MLMYVYVAILVFIPFMSNFPRHDEYSISVSVSVPAFITALFSRFPVLSTLTNPICAVDRYLILVFLVLFKCIFLFLYLSFMLLCFLILMVTLNLITCVLLFFNNLLLWFTKKWLCCYFKLFLMKNVYLLFAVLVVFFLSTIRNSKPRNFVPFFPDVAVGIKGIMVGFFNFCM